MQPNENPNDTRGVSVATLIKSVATLGGVILFGFVVVSKYESTIAFSASQWSALALLFFGGIFCAIKLDEKLLSRVIKNAERSENLSIGLCTLAAAALLYLGWELL